MSAALDILRSVYGYPDFHGQQQAIIEHVSAGGDALVLMPTGGGKSLCYQIPALLRPGTGIVISPLIALMQDQVDALVQFGVKAAFLNSSLDMRAAQAVEHRFLAGELDLLYVAPERLVTPRFLDLLERAQLALFAIDEAHCVSQWGHDFRPEYVELSLLHQHFPQVPRIALTATADEPTRREIVARLKLESAAHFIAGFDRPNIRYRVTQKQSAPTQLMAFIDTEHRADSGIVYCLSRKRVEMVAHTLVQHGMTALPYHAGMDAKARNRNQTYFLREDNVIMVATIAFGMGIDKPDVRFVAHLDLPDSVEAYYQETGRAGRDGLPANAWMAYGLADVILRRRLIADSGANEQHKRVQRHKLDALLGLCETTVCRRRVLLSYFGEDYAHDCGNCDNCIEHVQTWDGTTAAQMALSCVYRTGQRFGVGHLIEVLLGHPSERIRRLGHDQVSTFGIGKTYARAQWDSIYRQLVAAGMLSVDVEGFGALRLTEASRELLRGERTIHFREDAKPQKKARRPAAVGAASPADEALWLALKEQRSQLAREQGVPPYVIFHDATLRQMLEHKPRNLRELAGISGVGVKKLERYGAAFLAVLNTHGAGSE